MIDGPTRRQILGALAGSGTLAALAASGSGQTDPTILELGGGDMADESAQHRVKVYSGPLSERPSAGVEGRFWVTDSGAVYEDDGSSWNAADREYNSLSVSGFGRGNVVPAEHVSFTAEFVDEPSGINGTDDPILLHKSHFDDGEYRLGVKDFDAGTYELYRTADFESYTLISSDINGTNFQDSIVLPDGTFAVYNTNPSARATEVYTGTDLTSLTNQGNVIDTEEDCGVFLEGDTVHIFTEDIDNQDGVGSNKLSHWTTSTSDLTTATQQADAIDVTNKGWKTGDPEIIQYGDYYYMFMDACYDHPAYHIALARSTDLYEWTLMKDAITGRKGGDMVLVQNGMHYEALTEFTGPDTDGIGRWRVYPTTPLSDYGFVDLSVDTLHAIGSDTAGQELTVSSARGQILAMRRSTSDVSIIETENELDGLALGIGNTGSTELTIDKAGATHFDRQGSNVMSIKDDGAIHHAPVTSPPASPSNGDFVYADGTNWDPGSGAGFYGYENGAWVKL